MASNEARIVRTGLYDPVGFVRVGRHRARNRKRGIRCGRWYHCEAIECFDVGGVDAVDNGLDDFTDSG